MALPPPVVQPISASGSLFGALCPTSYGSNLVTNDNLTTRQASRELCLIGQPITAFVDKMLLEKNDGDNGSQNAHTEFCVAWPPTFPVGGSVEVVELRAAVSLDAATTAQVAAASNVYGGDPAVVRAAALRSAAAEVCGRVVAVREDVVVAEEGVRVDAAGRASARLRMSSAHTCVTSCILASDKGIPSLESLQDAAPLMALPQAARDEAHRLLWRMMHEALPPNHSTLPFDPDVFRSPLELLPPRLQAALSWAWSRHFRAFAHDFAFLLDCMPPGAAMNPLQVAISLSETSSSSGTGPLTIAAAAAATSGSAGSEAAEEETAHYHIVWMQMIGFLRDNDMFACLTSLMQAAFDRGLKIVVPEAADKVAAAAVREAPAAAPCDEAAAAAIASPALDIDVDDDGSDICNESLCGECVNDRSSSAAAEVPLAYPSTSTSIGAAVPSSAASKPSAMPQAAVRVLSNIGFCAILVILFALGGSSTWNEGCGASQCGAVAVQPLTAVLVAVTVTAGTYYIHSRENGDMEMEYLLDAVQISTAVLYMAAAAKAAVAAAPVEAIASAVASVALWRLPTGPIDVASGALERFARRR